MTNENKTFLNSLYSIESKIIKLYYELYNLEINQQKDSLEYQKRLKYIKLLSEIEEEEIETLTKNETLSCIEYLEEKNHFKAYSDFSLIINDNYDLYIEKRAYNHLKNELKERKKKENITDIEEFIYQDIYQEMLYLFLHHINKEKENIDNESYKNAFISELISAKLNTDVLP